MISESTVKTDGEARSLSIYLYWALQGMYLAHDDLGRSGAAWYRLLTLTFDGRGWDGCRFKYYRAMFSQLGDEVAKRLSVENLC